MRISLSPLISLKAARAKVKRHYLSFCVLIPACAFGFSPRTCEADTLQFNVQFSDVSSLGSNYFFVADLSDDGMGSLNSTSLTFDNFSGQSGAISPFTLSDTGPFNENSTPFTSGSATSPSPFRFNILADFTPDANNPDMLSVFFGSRNETANPTTGTLFNITFNSSNPGQIQYATFSNGNPNIPAPTISIVATPEPQTWAMMALGVGGLALVLRRKSQTGVTI